MKHTIAAMPGDGIGPEIVAEGRKVIDAVSEHAGFEIDWVDYDNGADRYLRTGELISEETMREMEESCDAVYLGALGDPRVKTGILEKGILLNMRFRFDEYVNLRPIKLLEGAWCPLRDKGPKDIDFTVVRENTEDFYVGIGGRANPGISKQELRVVRALYQTRFGLEIETSGSEIAYQLGVVSKKGAERAARYAFELAKHNGAAKVHAVDKANVLCDVYGLWRETVERVGKKYPGITHEFVFVDAATMWMVKNPEWFKVVVTPNMFGDIITDLGAMIQGGLGFAPGGNINPDGLSMFEPIHGSAPKYKGTNTANPIATIWAGALMLGEIGEETAKANVVGAIEDVVREGRVRTRDMGGEASTSAMGSAIAARAKARAKGAEENG